MIAAAFSIQIRLPDHFAAWLVQLSYCHILNFETYYDSNVPHRARGLQKFL
jgi:hypothetical protein